jgi:hypothetical protein
MKYVSEAVANIVVMVNAKRRKKINEIIAIFC